MKNGSQSWTTLPTSRSGEGTPISTSAATGTFHPSEAKQICWLKPGTQAHLALEEVVLNTKLLKDLAKLTDFCHTGRLISLNNA